MPSRRFAFLLLMLVATSAVAQFNPIPYVNQSLIPASGTPGHGGFTLTVTGTNFLPGATVLWNGRSRNTKFVSSTTLQAKIIVGAVAQPGTAEVKVTNPFPGGIASNVVYFPVRNSSPTVTTVDSGFVANGTVRVIADFNRDGIPDIAVADTVSGGIAVYVGNGDGTFQPAKISRPGLFFNALVVGDFNGDGKLDLAASFPYLCYGCGGYPSYILNIYLGVGDGHFKEVLQPKRRFGWPLAAADFNGDGRYDLITTSTGYDGTDWFTAIYLGTDDGRLVDQAAIWDTFVPGIPAVGDFNGDGKLDFAMNAFDGYQGNPVSEVFLGNGDGSFLAPALYPKTFPTGGFAVAAADLNGDGKLDLASDSGDVFLGNGDGTFSHDGNANVEGSYLAGVRIAEMNGDGKLDIVTNGFNYASHNLVLLGNGAGSFTPVATTGNGIVLGAADFNGDGELDVLTSTGLFLQAP